MEVHVDLNAKILHADSSAFLARAGSTCRYLNYFRDLCAIGPDLPYVELERGMSIDDHNRMELMLRRSEAFRRWMPKYRHEDPPSRELLDYVHADRVNPRSRAQYKRILKGYFEVAKKGDLALVPPSAWQSDALLIEFSTDPDEFVYRQIPYGDRFVDIPVRKFEEIGTIQKRFLPRHILSIVTKPTAFVQLGTQDTESLQRIAYDSFIRQNHSIIDDSEYSSTFHVSSEKYNLDHDLLFALFVKTIAANCKAISESRGPLSITEAYLEDLGEYTPTLKSNVNSPGLLKLIACRVSPLVASALLVIAVEIGPEAIDAAENGMITIGNSKASVDDPCVARVRRETLDFLKLLRLDEWAPICDLARKVSDETGLSSQATVSHVEKGIDHGSTD